MEHIAPQFRLMPFQDSWPRPTLPIRLLEDDIHIWRFEFMQLERYVARLAKIISEEELSRAADFYSIEYRKRFIVRRGVVRTILSFYLNTEPSQLEFSHNHYGKPHLTENVPFEQTLQFSLTHSLDLSLCAVTMGRNVGVDLEYVQNTPDIEEVASRFFSKRENAMIRALPKDRRARAFYEIWTQKEAYVKAIGTGLAAVFDEPDAELSQTQDKPLALKNYEKTDESLWSIISITPAPNYTATAIAEGDDLCLHIFQFGLDLQ
ncbi:4'-phosphopantetheinyl transferase superfamily protein [Candidatus Bathyarchaeota archaeon]|nr:4'-phosphopantetheinyl transferase superfamily protein [Candidatus Bathyarchaeota archaeon]